MTTGTGTAPRAGVGRRARLLLTLVAGILLFALSGAGFAHACSCAPATLDEAIEERDLIAEVTIIGRAPLPSGRGATYEARVEKVWKGEESRRVLLSTSQHITACGLGYLPTGTTFLVWASGEDGSYSSSWCAIPDDVGSDARGALTAKVGEPTDLTDQPVPILARDLIPADPVMQLSIALLSMIALGNQILSAAAVAAVLRRSSSRGDAPSEHARN